MKKEIDKLELRRAKLQKLCKSDKITRLFHSLIGLNNFLLSTFLSAVYIVTLKFSPEILTISYSTVTK